jgi:predicted  nucleic acid-binding Zn-ribbon protein
MNQSLETKISGFEDAIFRFLERMKISENSRLLSDMREKDAAYATAQRTYLDAYGRTVALEHEMAALHQSIKSGRAGFEEDFERINRMAGVRKVEIGAREEALYVFTEPLIQTVGFNQFDIGQFIISLNYVGAPPYSRDIVAFKRGPYRGKYSHANALENPGAPICFGGDGVIGLNTSMDKLCADCDIVPAIHLILAFLQRDTVSPRTIIEDQATPIPPDRRSYLTAAERTVQKNAYASFCAKIKSRIAVKGLGSQYAELRARLGTARAEALNLRCEMKSLTDLYRAVSKIRKDELRKLAKAEARLLAACPQVIRLVNEGTSLAILFFWCDNEFALELSPLGPPRIRGERTELENLTGIISPDGYFRTGPKLLASVAGKVAESRLSRAFFVVLEMLDSYRITRGERDGLIS